MRARVDFEWKSHSGNSGCNSLVGEPIFHAILMLWWYLRPGHYKTWTLDWTMDWTLDSIMDSIIALDSWSSGSQVTQRELWCSWCCKLEGLIISTLQNYRRDNHFRWDSNLVQSLCFSKPDECLRIGTTQFISSMTMYAEDWNPKPSEYQSDTLSYRWAHHWSQHRRVKASLHKAAQAKRPQLIPAAFLSHSFYTVYKWRFPAGSTMPEWILSLPATTASGKVISQRIVAHYTTGIK